MVKLVLFIKHALAIVCAFIGTLIYASTNKELRNALDAFIRTKQERAIDFIGLKEWGLCPNKEYMSFAQMVSNDYKNVFANVNEIATNNAERLLVFAVGWQFDEEFYLLCLEELADLGLKGKVTAFEIKWYRCLNHDSKYTNMLRVRYKEPRIIELVKKLMQVEPKAKKYYEKILTGESYQEYLQEMKARLWG